MIYKTKHTNKIFSLTGIHCGGCVKRVEEILLSVEGVCHAKVNFVERTATVSGDADHKNVIHALEAVGYGARLIRNFKPVPIEY